MMFRAELAAMVMDGSKTCTRRLLSENPRSPWFQDRCGYRVGQVIAICPGRGKHQIGRLCIVDAREARREGFESVDAFREAWEAINGGYDPEAGVWRIGLRAIQETS